MQEGYTILYNKQKEANQIYYIKVIKIKGKYCIFEKVKPNRNNNILQNPKFKKNLLKLQDKNNYPTIYKCYNNKFYNILKCYLLSSHQISILC